MTDMLANAKNNTLMKTAHERERSVSTAAWEQALMGRDGYKNRKQYVKTMKALNTGYEIK